MATSLSTTMKLTLCWIHNNSLVLGDVKDSNSLVLEDSLADGTGLDQADQLWHDRRNLAAGANDDLDLSRSLTNAFGQTVSFVKIKAVLIRNRTATVGVVLVVGGGDDGVGGNAFASWLGDVSDKIKIGPDGAAMLWNPSAAAFAVTAGTGDVLRINNSSGSDAADYDVVIMGTTS